MIYDLQLDKVAGLANLSKNCFCMEQSSGGKSYGGHFLHTYSSGRLFQDSESQDRRKVFPFHHGPKGLGFLIWPANTNTYLVRIYKLRAFSIPNITYFIYWQIAMLLVS